MALYLFSALNDDDHIAFDPDADELRFDNSLIPAANVRLVVSSGNVGLILLGKTIWLDGVSIGQLNSANVTFADGSLLGVGGDDTGLFRDAYGAFYDLEGVAGSHHVRGLGGADVVLGGDGNDYIVGNDALTPLAHVSQVGGFGSPNSSYLPSISADGRYVGFYGGWTGFGSQSNSATDVFVKDMETGAVTNEHKTISGAFPLSGSGVPRISADGNWLAFWSNSNLTEESPAVGSQIYVADTLSGNVLAASTTAGGVFSNGPTDNPDISATGRYVVFESRADNLAAGANVNIEDIYLKDMQTGTLTRVSTSLTGGDANAEALDPSISANGRYVVFSSAATNLTANKTGSFKADVYLFDRTTGGLTNITGGRGGVFEALNPDVAADSAGGVSYGGVVVFQTGKKLVADDTNNAVDIYAYDIAAGTYERVSTQADGGQVALSSYNPAVSGDGRFVAFTSGSAELVAGDTNGYADVFVKDRFTGEIALVSRLPGAQANQTSGSTLDISLGGDWIVFESSASNLASSDDNGGLPDVFRVANPLLRDVLRGGRGNDTYVLERRDVVVEDAGEGTDTVEAGLSYTLGANLENLVLTGTGHFNGTGNGLANVISSNAGNNVIDGKGGVDTASYARSAGAVAVSLALTGPQATGHGNDRLISIENLIGSAQADRLTGDDGANRLDGGLGGDTLAGGLGNDVYVVNAATDITTGDGGGTDTVISGVNWTLQSFLENLTLTGTALNGGGNSKDNRITGNAGANQLAGFSGNDTLDGGVGNDTLSGGIGDDTYVVDSAADITTGDGGGVDTVVSGVNWTLQSFLENLTLTGAATNGGGNGAANILTGNGGNNRLDGAGSGDTLIGAAGNDTLLGGLGGDQVIGGTGADRVEIGGDTSRDVIVFNARGDSPVGAGRDIVAGFDSGEDAFDLRSIDADTGVGGNQAFGFSGAAARAHSVWVVDTGADLLVRLDVTGDTTADMEIRVNGITGLLAGDFLL